MEPESLALKGGFLTTKLPGKSLLLLVISQKFKKLKNLPKSDPLTHPKKSDYLVTLHILTWDWRWLRLNHSCAFYKVPSLIYVTCLAPVGTWDFHLWSKPLWHIIGAGEESLMPTCDMNIVSFGSSTCGQCDPVWTWTWLTPPCTRRMGDFMVHHCDSRCIEKAGIRTPLEAIEKAQTFCLNLPLCFEKP